MEFHKLRERTTAVNYTITGLHVTHTPGWLKGDNNKTMRATLKDRVDEENELKPIAKRLLRRQSAPARQPEREFRNQPAKDGLLQEGSRKLKKAGTTDSRTVDGKDEAAPAGDSSKFSVTGSGGRKRRTSRTFGISSAKRPRTSQGNRTIKIISGHKGPAEPAAPAHSGAKTQRAGGNWRRGDNHPPTAQQGINPEPMQQRLRRGLRRSIKPLSDPLKDPKATTVEANAPNTAVEPTTTHCREVEVQPTTISTIEARSGEPLQQGHPREGMRPEPAPESLVLVRNPECDVPLPSHPVPDGQHSTNFLALQVGTSVLASKQ